jgi:allantoin racemase
MAVLDLDALPPEEVRARLVDVAQDAVTEDGAEVICLGCAGMAGLEEAIHAATGVPVVDGVRAALALVRSLVDSGLQTSKHNLYRPVDRRPANGLPAGIARGYGNDPG